MVTREYLPAEPNKVLITFSLPASIWADNVQLAGDFNGWDAAAMALRRDETGWAISLLLDQGHTYAYYYLIDHEHVTDWNADGYVVASDGSRRSLLVVAPPFTPPA